jgi:hypothetical protein
MDKNFLNLILSYCESGANSEDKSAGPAYSYLLGAMLEENFGFQKVYVYVHKYSHAISIRIGDKEVIYKAGKELKSADVFIGYILKDFIFTH